MTQQANNHLTANISFPCIYLCFFFALPFPLKSLQPEVIDLRKENGQKILVRYSRVAYIPLLFYFQYSISDEIS